MSEDLLTYYNRELTWFRQALAMFAETHPNTAGNLRVSEDAVEDPHISRLIESVAFLNARIQSRLDDDFPRVVAALLEHLYPFYLAPKPSMLLAQMQVAAELDSVLSLDAGYAFETEAVNGVKCQFQTTYPVTLTPLNIAEAQLLSKPFSTPGSDTARGADAVLALKLSTPIEDFSAEEADLDKLTLHIKPDQHTWKLYDLLYKDCLRIVVASSDLDPSPSFINPEQLRPLGFADEESVLPKLGDTESLYQLLGEYFYYSEKFLFFELSGLKRALAGRLGGFQIYFYLADSNRELENTISARSFSLHCTPMLNLFETAAEPVTVKQETAEYQVIADTNSIGDTEVYAITHVEMLEEGSGERNAIPPYYGFSHDAQKSPVYWHGSRRAALTEVGKRGAATDYFLALTTLAGSIPESGRQTMDISCLCSNGNLPGKLPYGGGQPRFTAVQSKTGLTGASSLSPPTPARRLDIGSNLLWRLLAHLNLNYLSLVGGKNPAEQLREMLRIYDHGDAPVIRAQINAVDSLKTRIISLPMSVDGRPVICRGVDVEIIFDASLLDSGSALLFGNVLMKFLSMYVNLNSFVRLTVRIKGRDGIYHRWEPLVGSRALI